MDYQKRGEFASATKGVPLITAKSTKTGELLDATAKQPPFTAADIGYAVPIGDKVFVQPRQPAARSAGGVLLPDEAQPVPTRGVVVAVGPGNHTITGVLVPVALQVGDEVQYVAQAFSGGIKIKGVDGVERFVLVMSEHDVFAKFSPPKADEPA